jgi:translation elongation factor EF-1alpha
VVKITEERLVGKVIHYYSKIGVAVVRIVGSLRLGEKIRITGGRNTDFTQIVASMEIEHQKIELAYAGEEIGLKVEEIAREGYDVYKS